MTETTATTPADHPSTPFVRPHEGRIVAGVCAGVAERWNLDVTLVRVATVVLTLFSGAGLVGYLAAWLLTASTDGPAPLHADSPAARAVSRHGDRLGRRLPALLAIGLGAILLVGLAHTWWFGVWHWLGVPFAVLAAVAVLAVIVGSRRVSWVFAALALLVALAIGAVGAFGPHLGTRTYHVTSIGDLRSSYDYDAGTVRLDLTDLATVAGGHHTAVRVGRGDVTVTVPPDTPVVVHAHSGLGSVTVDGHTVSGLDVEQTRSVGDAAASSADRLDVDVVVGVGDVDVRTA